MFLIKAIFLYLFFVGTPEQGIANSNSSVSQFDSYYGYLENDQIDQNQYAKMDFVLTRTSSNAFRLKAVLSLYFGDFGSDEYASYHFDDVQYNIVTGILIFDQSDQDLTLITTKFKNGFFEARVISSISGEIGVIKLGQKGAVPPKRLTVKSVQGRYAGSCDGKPSFLNLQTYKSSTDTSRLGNPFGSYGIVGQQGDYHTFTCPNSRNRPCNSDFVRTGSFDFYRGQMILYGRRLTYECTVKGLKLDCGSCVFEKKANSYDRDRQIAPLTSKPQFDPANSPTNVPATNDPIDGSGISGHYTGYVHHERLNRYQSASMIINSYQAPGGNGSTALMISASATLAFGEHDSSERITYRFDPTEYNLLNNSFVLERTGDDVDAMVQVEKLSNGEVTGTWYSIKFGRVGTFKLSKLVPIKIPENVQKMGKISGEYESKTFLLRVATRLGSAPPNTENPFFPLIFGGRFYYKSGIAAKKSITGGSYDFYTDKVAFEVDADKRVSVGRAKTSSKLLHLYWPPKVLTSPMAKFKTEAFLRP